MNEEVTYEMVEQAKTNGFSIREKHVNIGISQLDTSYDYEAIKNDPDFWKAFNKTN